MSSCDRTSRTVCSSPAASCASRPCAPVTSVGRQSDARGAQPPVVRRAGVPDRSARLQRRAIELGRVADPDAEPGPVRRHLHCASRSSTAIPPTKTRWCCWSTACRARRGPCPRSITSPIRPGSRCTWSFTGPCCHVARRAGCARSATRWPTRPTASASWLPARRFTLAQRTCRTRGHLRGGHRRPCRRRGASAGRAFHPYHDGGGNPGQGERPRWVTADADSRQP